MTSAPLTRRAALAAMTGAPAILRAQNRRPNFLFVITDDQRADAMSCAGNRILKTPNMDRLAAGGVRFTEAFVTNPLCSPSRACILSGQYSFANGVTTNGDGQSNLTGGSHFFRDSTVTYPMLLQNAGYYNVMVGKIHVATTPKGFDQYSILPGQGVYHDPILIANGARAKFRGYVDDIIADQAIETIRSRPKDKPWSMWCGFKAPHRTWQPAERFAKVYDDIEIPEPPLFNEPLSERPKAIRESDMQIADMPDFAERGVPASLPLAQRKKLNYQQYVKNYYRTLLGVDENLGRVLDFLDKDGLAENTVVIYMSDNGFFMGEYGMFDKRMMYEPSIRVPLLVRYPGGGVKPGQVDRSHMMIGNDVAHTILDYAGVNRPAAMTGHGESWRPVLEGRAAQWRQTWLYNYFEYPAVHCVGMARGVRSNRYKLIHYIQEPQAWEFFDLEKDPQERKNLYEDPAHQGEIAKLKQELVRLRKQVGDNFANDGEPMRPCTARMAGNA